MTNLQSAQMENWRKKNRRDVNYSYQCTETSIRHHVIVLLYNVTIIILLHMKCACTCYQNRWPISIGFRKGWTDCEWNRDYNPLPYSFTVERCRWRVSRQIFTRVTNIRVVWWRSKKWKHSCNFSIEYSRKSL